MTTTPLAPAQPVLSEERALAAPRRTRRWAAALATLLVVLGAEAGARALAPRLPRPLEWNQREAALIVEQMKRVGHADAVFLGSSVANFGFEPDVFAKRTGLRAYNAALPGSSLLSVEPWTKEMVVPLLKPRVAVIGITSRDVNDLGPPQRENLTQYLSSAERKRMLGIESALERAERFASEHSALVRLRRYLRRPASAAKHLRGEAALERMIAFGPSGEPRFPEVDYAFAETPTRRAWEVDALRGFDFPRNLEALGRLVAWLRAHAIRVVIVDMPVVEDIYAPYHPRGHADFDAYRAALRAETARLGVPLLSFSEGWDPQRFHVDSIHLNRAGATRLTDAVATRLEMLGLTAR